LELKTCGKGNMRDFEEHIAYSRHEHFGQEEKE